MGTMELAGTFYKKHKMQLLIVFSAIIMFINLLNLYAIFTVARVSNDECIWNFMTNEQGVRRFYFTQMKVGGVTWNAGIREEDMLLKINDIPVVAPLQAQQIIDKMAGGKIAEYTVQRNDSVFIAHVALKKLTNSGDVGKSLMALVWFGIGFIVLMAKPDGEIQRLFYKIGVSFTIAQSYSLVYPYLPEIAYNRIFNIYLIALIISYGMFSYWLIRFFSIFPNRLHFSNKKWSIRFLQAIVISAIIGSLIRFFFYVDHRLLNRISFLGFLGPINALISFSFVTGLVLLIVNYFKVKDKAKRKPIFIIIVAYSLAILSIIFVGKIVPSFGVVQYNYPEYYTPIILVAILPLAFAYSIFKYQLMDVSFVVKNMVFYGTATFGLGIIYLLSVYGIGLLLGRFVSLEYKNFVTLFTFILFALSFQSTKDRFQESITKRFYPEQFAYQKYLLEFNQEFANILGLDKIYEALEKLFIEQIRVQKFAIAVKKTHNVFEVGREKNFSQFPAHVNIDIESYQKHVEMTKLTKAIPVIDQSNMALFFPDDYQTLIEHEVYTMVPLLIRSRVIGFIMLGLKHSGSQFIGKDLELLYALANQTAIALENARLYETEAEKLKIERDLEVAKRIQQGSLPKELPVIPHVDIYGTMIPAMQVGGDYYDVIMPGKNKMFVIVGDVSGKGLSASLYMSKIQTLFQLACSNGHSPKEILIDLNRKIFNVFDKNSFATIGIGLFDFEKQTLRYCRAGHLPLIIGHDGITTEIKSRGIGIGLEKGEVFEKSLVEEEIALKAGQIFVFYSDGINEAMNESNEQFETERLTQIVQAKNASTCNEIAESIWSSVRDFRASAEQNDDMTLVLVKMV